MDFFNNYKKEILKIRRAETGKLRSFCFIFAAAFSVLAGIGYYRSGSPDVVLPAAGIFFLFSALFVPGITKPFYIIWMSFGYFMNFLMTRLMLLFLFFFIMTPLGLLLRIIGKDILDEKIDKKVESYWKDNKITENREQYLKQF